MPDSNFSTLPFDWISDRAPIFAAQATWEDGTYQQQATYHYMYRAEGPFVLACGAGLLAEHIRRFRFTPAIIQRMGQVRDDQGSSAFKESFLNHLQRMRLRVQVNVAPEGTLLLPGEPLLVVQGPLLQIQLLESAFRLLIWESTHWATMAATTRWKNSDYKEEDTPSSPVHPFNPDGWKIRGAYVGGAAADEILDNVGRTMRPAFAGEGLVKNEHTPGEPMVQIRRLFKGNQPLGDVWLTQKQEEEASVSRTHTQFIDERNGALAIVNMTRFQNIYQPVLEKGHPTLATPRLGYLRQRMLKQLEVFQVGVLEGYPHGWYERE